MHHIRKRRLIWVLVSVGTLAIAAGLVLYALRQNISLFYTPTQATMHQVPINKHIRIGGLVEQGSVHRQPGDLQVTFRLTDTANDVTVHYEGILPDLFREGQGVVAQGKLAADGSFQAQEVLAKHDSNYTPPEVKTAMAQAKMRKLQQGSDQ